MAKQQQEEKETANKSGRMWKICVEKLENWREFCKYLIFMKTSTKMNKIMQRQRQRQTQRQRQRQLATCHGNSGYGSTCWHSLACCHTRASCLLCQWVCVCVWAREYGYDYILKAHTLKLTLGTSTCSSWQPMMLQAARCLKGQKKGGTANGSWSW